MAEIRRRRRLREGEGTWGTFEKRKVSWRGGSRTTDVCFFGGRVGEGYGCCYDGSRSGVEFLGAMPDAIHMMNTPIGHFLKSFSEGATLTLLKISFRSLLQRCTVNEPLKLSAKKLRAEEPFLLVCKTLFQKPFCGTTTFPTRFPPPPLSPGKE